MKIKDFFKIAFVFLILCFFSFGQEIDLEKICPYMKKLEEICRPLSERECRTILEKCEDFLNQKSELLLKEVKKLEKKKRSLKQEISFLEKKIARLNYQIKRNQLMVKDLILEIKEREMSILKTNEKIKFLNEDVKKILRKIWEEERRSLFEIFILKGSLSQFFLEISLLKTLFLKLQTLSKDIEALGFYLKIQQEELIEKKEELVSLIKIGMLQQAESKKVAQEKERLLKFTENQYQKYRKEKETIERQAHLIRSRIFELIGVKKAPTFGEAYELARYVSKITGIRPAFLLAILTQESNIGKNVGQCLLTDFEKGTGVKLTSRERVKRVMNPKRDIPYFLKICKRLKRDPYNTVVSCPMRYGWGGAMGPAQFLPSTWMNPRLGIQFELEKILNRPADPWEIKDAFLAAGIYLKKLKGDKNEFLAAMRYFSGARWSKWEEFYGRAVLKLAKKYQQEIEILEKSS